MSDHPGSVGGKPPFPPPDVPEDDGATRISVAREAVEPSFDGKPLFDVLPDTEVPKAAPSNRTTASALGSAPGGGPLNPGVVLSSTFEIEHLLARGGMGEVYRARHRITGDPIAIKTIRPELADDEKISELFKREAQALRNIRHPAIVSYEGVFDDGTGALYIAMEFVDGPSLSKLMQSGPLPVADVRLLRDRVASGLAAAHAQGVVHRDLSPDNVILTGGQINAAKLIDFGIAKQTESSKATVIGNDFAGKYSYAAPEQLGLQGGDVGPRADIYSLGLVLAAAAIGTPLDMGNALPTAVAARMRVPDLARIPAELRDEIGAMLQPNPDDRPQSMAELVRPATGSRGSRSPNRPSQPGVRRGSGPMIAGIAAAVLILAGGGAFVMKDRLFPPPPETPGTTTTAGNTKPGTSTDPVTPGGTTPGTTTPPSTGTTTPPSTGSTTSPPSPGTTTPDTPTTAGTTPPEPSTGSTKPPVMTGSTSPPPLTTGSTEPSTPSEPAKPDVSVVRSRLDALISRFDCADLTGRVDPDRTVRLRGYVQSDGDRAQLLDAARAIDGVPGVDAGVSVQPWPACDLVRVVSGATTPNFRVVPDKVDRPYKIRTDRVSFRVYPPAGRQGLLNVVFLQSDRTVWHYEAWSKMRIRPGQVETFGDKLSITLAPPAGKMAIVAVISPEPLFASPQGDEQPIKDYLTTLKLALARQPDAIVSYVVFDTVE